MENNQKLLEQLEKHSARQLLFTQILCGVCIVAVILCLVMTLSITGAAKELMALAEPLQQAAGQVQTMATQAETVMNNLEVVTQTLADADLGNMVGQVNSLAADSQTAVSAAMEKLDTVDIETLNKAIRDLSAVVEPLAKLTKIW